VKRKFGKYGLKDEKIVRKAYLLLKHRGFSHETIMQTIGKLADTQGDRG
jgi:SOS response regulatory protein OraA/RecX